MAESKNHGVYVKDGVTRIAYTAADAVEMSYDGWALQDQPAAEPSAEPSPKATTPTTPVTEPATTPATPATPVTEPVPSATEPADKSTTSMRARPGGK